LISQRYESVRIKRKIQVFSVEKSWSSPQFETSHCSPVIYPGNHLFGFCFLLTQKQGVKNLIYCQLVTSFIKIFAFTDNAKKTEPYDIVFLLALAESYLKGTIASKGIK